MIFKIRFSKEEVNTPLTMEEYTAQLDAILSEDDVETGMLKTFKKDEKGYFLQFPMAEMEPGMVPAIRKARGIRAAYLHLQVMVAHLKQAARNSLGRR